MSLAKLMSSYLIGYVEDRPGNWEMAAVMPDDESFIEGFVQTMKDPKLSLKIERHRFGPVNNPSLIEEVCRVVG